jgi:hypothetical protein
VYTFTFSAKCFTGKSIQIDPIDVGKKNFPGRSPSDSD